MKELSYAKNGSRPARNNALRRDDDDRETAVAIGGNARVESTFHMTNNSRCECFNSLAFTLFRNAMRSKMADNLTHRIKKSIRIIVVFP
jgi:hypothetical protein